MNFFFLIEPFSCTLWHKKRKKQFTFYYNKIYFTCVYYARLATKKINKILSTNNNVKCDEYLKFYFKHSYKKGLQDKRILNDWFKMVVRIILCTGMFCFQSLRHIIITRTYYRLSGEYNIKINNTYPLSHFNFILWDFKQFWILFKIQKLFY